jgi:hypothetical protein
MWGTVRSVQGIQVQFQWCGSESLVEEYKTSERGSNGAYIGDQDSIKYCIIMKYQKKKISQNDSLSLKSLLELHNQI